MNNVIFTSDIKLCLAEKISHINPDKIFVLTDNNTSRHCLPKLIEMPLLRNASTIEISSGDENKNIKTLEAVLTVLSSGGATRHSLLINVGGGMVTDLGGFAASIYKRGLSFINVPTTLLAMVDASVGGKTGVNFNGLKNEIGVFADIAAVIIDTCFLDTFDVHDLLSGYAEMLKHSLLSDEKMWVKHISFDMFKPDFAELLEMIKQSVGVKSRIVEQDPYESSFRKALNLGHTIGHSIEALSIKKHHPMSHGCAVAWGLVGESFLSAIKCGFPQDKLAKTVSFIRSNYERPQFNCDDYPALIELMHHDKKNTEFDKINFTFLSDIGQIKLDECVTKQNIEDALDYILMG